MATAYALPTAATPIERILSRFDRRQIEDFIEDVEAFDSEGAGLALCGDIRRLAKGAANA